MKVPRVPGRGIVLLLGALCVAISATPAAQQPPPAGPAPAAGQQPPGSARGGGGDGLLYVLLQNPTGSGTGLGLAASTPGMVIRLVPAVPK